MIDHIDKCAYLCIGDPEKHFYLPGVLLPLASNRIIDQSSKVHILWVCIGQKDAKQQSNAGV